MSRFLWFTVY